MTRPDEQPADGLTDEEIMMSLSELDARERDIDKRLEELSPGSTQGDGVALKHHLDVEKKQEWDDLFKERGEIGRRMRQLEKRSGFGN